MRFALISDIHANLEALTAVLKDITNHRVDSIHCLGDVIGYGCNPVECLELVEKKCQTKLMGNHEFAVLGLLASERLNDLARQSLEWTKQQLSDRELALIADYALEAKVAGCHLVHASPFEANDWHYILNENEAKLAFETARQPLTFHGHTHLPMVFSTAAGDDVTGDDSIRCQIGHDFDPDEESRYLINVGSVGQPRDNDSRAGYVIFDRQEYSVAFHRVTYDIKATQARMSEAKLPTMLIERLEIGK